MGLVTRRWGWGAWIKVYRDLKDVTVQRTVQCLFEAGMCCAGRRRWKIREQAGHGGPWALLLGYGVSCFG